MINALLVGIVYYISVWLSAMGGVFHFNRPIIVGPLVGLVLGDLQTGIILGATFESVFLGVIAVGGSVPADATTGAIIGTAIAILSNSDSDTALAIAVPVSLFGLMLMQLTNAYLPLFLPKMDSLAAAGDEKGFVRYHFIMSAFYPLLGAVAVFLAVLLGANTVQSIISAIPQFITDGFAAAGAMLPAVGFAMLLNMLFNKKVFPFFFLGFVLVIYLNLPSLAVAIIAVVFAIWQFNLDQKKNTNQSFNNDSSGHLNTGSELDEEEFFA